MSDYYNTESEDETIDDPDYFNIEEDEDEDEEEEAEGVSPPVTPLPAQSVEQPPAPERGFARQNAVRPFEEGEALSPIAFEGVEAENPSGVEGAVPLGYEYDLPEDFNYATYNIPVGIEVEEETYARTNYGLQVNAAQRDKSSELILASDNEIYVGLNLLEEDLTNLNLDNKVFISCIFAGADMTNTSMRKCVLYNCNLTRAIMTNINLSGSFIYNCNMSDAECINGIFSNIYCKYPDGVEVGPEWFDERPFLLEVIVNRARGAGQLPAIEDEDEKVVQLNRANLLKANFNNAALNNVSFMNAKMQYATLITAICNKASFEYATLHEANFTNTKCIKAVFTGAKAKQICFNHANLNSANCREADFRHGDFRRTILNGAIMDDCKLDKAIIQNCNATSIHLNNAYMRECIIRDTLFNREGSFNSDITNTNLTGSIFINCNLKNTYLNDSKCCDVQFIGCNLTQTSFNDGYLLRASFVNCNTTGFILTDAVIDNDLIADLTATGFFTPEAAAAERERFSNHHIDEAADCHRPPVEPPNFTNTSEELDPLFMTEEAAPVVAASAVVAPAVAAPAVAAPASLTPDNTQRLQDIEDENRWYWNPKPEKVAEMVHPEENEEEEAPIEDAAGNRVRMPEERDGAVYRAMFTTNPPGSLRFMNFKNCNFEGYDFSVYPDLTGTSFFGCNLIDAIFAGCLLKDTNFQWADIINANFSGARFEGDYDAGGLLEGATIMNCVFEGTLFNGQDRSDVYNDTTYVQPYDPIPYPDEDLLIAPIDVINSNLKGTVKSDDEEIQETEKRIQDFLTTPQNMVFRVVDYETSFNDFLVEENYVRKFLVNDSSVVFPCRKPFNIPGPSYPGPNETSYHDITRPFVNVGIILSKRVWVQKDKFMTALNTTLENNIAHPEAKKGLVFFKGENAETVPTFVSKPVLSDGASWVSNLHCNSGAEKETLWFVKVVDLVAGELPDEEDMSAFDMLAEEEAPAFEGEYIDPYADESDTDSEAPVPVVAYNPPADNRTVSIPLTDPLFDINNATGKITRMSHYTKNAQGENVPISPEKKTMTVLTSLENIEQQITNGSTTTIVLIIKDERGLNNYIIKFNDFIELFSNNRQDYMPCKKVMAVNPNDDIVKERRLINIGAIINKQIFIDKRQLMELFPNNKAVSEAKKKVTFYLQFNENSEKIPGVTKFSLLAPLCKEPAVTVWDLQKIPNNFYRVNDVVKLLMPEEHAEELFKIVEIPPENSNIFINVFDYAPDEVMEFNLANMLDITIEDRRVIQTIDGEKIRHYFIQPLDQESPPILTPSTSLEKVLKESWPPQGSSQNSSEEEEEEEEEEETYRSSEESIQSEEAPRQAQQAQAQAPFVLPPNPVPIDNDAPEPILPENDPYKVGNSVMFDRQNSGNLNSYDIVEAGSNQNDIAVLHLREPVEGFFDPTTVEADYNKLYSYRILREGGFLRNSAGQYFKNGERYIFIFRLGAGSTPTLVNVKDVVLPESMAGGIGIVKLRGHNNTLRKHFRHNMNNTLRRQLYKKKSRQLQRKFKKEFTRRADKH